MLYWLQVAELNKMVADLEAQFDAANQDKNDAIAEQERCDLKLSLANRLITALSSEGERWAATVEQLKGDYDVLTGDMLFASAFVSYAGPFTASFRADLNTQFLAFMKSKGTPMTNGLSDPLKVCLPAFCVHELHTHCTQYTVHLHPAYTLKQVRMVYSCQKCPRRHTATASLHLYNTII